MNDLQRRVAEAVKYFWATRQRQAENQGRGARGRDRGGRSAVTGGAQLDGFAKLVRECLVDSGIPDPSIYRRQNVTLPGYFRPTKEWDLLVVVEGTIVASLEFKSQVGSFGNNFNNRTEEVVGSAHDLWIAYREGAFKPSGRPWLGYFMLLEEARGSTEPVGVKEPHFKVFEEFRGTSYAKRYELLCQRLVRERLYDAAALILSDPKSGLKGRFNEPSAELSFRNFIRSLTAAAIAFAQSRGQER